MEPLSLLLIAACVGLGAVVGFLARSGAARLAEERGARLAELERRLEAREAEAQGAVRRTAEAEARLAAERASAAEKLALVEDARARLTDAFKALSAEALRESSASFLALARTSLEKYQAGARGELEKREKSIAELLSPVKDSLGKLDGQLRELEKTREGAYSALTTQLKGMAEAQGQLRAEASSLVRALHRR